MRKIILLLVLAFGFVFTSCDKNNPEPNEPTPTTQSGGSVEYDSLFIVHTNGYDLDSVIFQGGGFSVDQNDAVLITCPDISDNYKMFVFPLFNTVTSGDEITVTTTNSELGSFNLKVHAFVTNTSRSNICDESENFNGVGEASNGDIQVIAP